MQESGKKSVRTAGHSIRCGQLAHVSFFWLQKIAGLFHNHRQERHENDLRKRLGTTNTSATAVGSDHQTIARFLKAMLLQGDIGRHNAWWGVDIERSLIAKLRSYLAPGSRRGHTPSCRT